jgi:WD40 repeat protein
MRRRAIGALSALALLAACAALAPGQDEPTPPATLELILPAGATATANGKPPDDARSVTVGDLKPGEIRRVKVAVTFADGATDERLVDVTAGQRIPVPVPHPGPGKAGIVGMHALTPINSAAVGRDGRYVAVGLDDRTVVLWDTAAGRPVRTLTGHQKAVLAVAFTPDGKHLLSGSADSTAILWDVEAGVAVRTYSGHTGSVLSVAFSPDGAQFLTGSPDGTAILWQTQTGERVHTLKSRGILGVAYSPDGTTLATASTDYTATLWDTRTGQPTVVLRGHREDVTCVAFSPDSRRVITGSNEDLGIVWDAASGKRITPTGRHTNDVRSVAFTLDGRRVITGEREELVMMWDAATGAPARTFGGHSDVILSLVPSPDGRTLLTGSRDGTARLWDLATGRELLALTTDGARKTWAVVSPDGLFDGPEPGRRALGYRFPKMPGGEVDAFFAEGYRPGLLAEVWRGGRPFPAKPVGRNTPPLVKLVPPKERVSTAPTATLTADVLDQGGGVGAFVVENNGVRLAVPTKAEATPGGKSMRVTFTVPLAPGPNKIRVRATDRDGSWESDASEVELAHPRLPGQRGRLYVVAVGVSEYAEKGLNLNYPAKDARALAELLRARGAPLYDRIDVVPVLDRDATRATIEDTVKDVAELTRPQDMLVVLLCGHGALVRDRLYFAPHDLRPGTDRPEDALRKRGVAVDDVAAVMGTAPALSRVLVVDAASSGEAFGGALAERSEFGLRVAVERWGRYHGVHALAAVAATNRAVERPELGRGLLAHSLLDAPGGDAVDVTDWFRSAADRATSVMLKLTGSRQDVQAGTRSKGFPFLAPDK